MFKQTVQCMLGLPERLSGYAVNASERLLGYAVNAFFLLLLRLPKRLLGYAVNAFFLLWLSVLRTCLFSVIKSLYAALHAVPTSTRL